MYCSKCGYLCDDNESACSMCGFVLKEKAHKSLSNSELFKFMEMQRKLDEFTGKIESKENSSKLKKVIAIVVLLILIGVEGLLYFDEMAPLIEQRDAYLSSWISEILSGADINYNYLADEINEVIMKMAIIGVIGVIIFFIIYSSATKDDKDIKKYEKEKMLLVNQINVSKFDEM